MSGWRYCQGMSKKLYAAVVTAKPGSIASSDGVLSVDVHEPDELGGPGGATNPEQLMAAALGSCLVESLRIALGTAGGSTEGMSVKATVTLTDSNGAGYEAEYELKVELPGVSEPENILAQATSICPFLKSIEGVQVSMA